MLSELIIDVLDLEWEGMLTGEISRVDEQLTSSGWHGTTEDSASGNRWRTETDDQIHVHTSQQGTEFYLGLIVGFDSNAKVDACASVILDHLRPRLESAGFGPQSGDDAARVWTNATHAVTLYITHQRQQPGHVVPPVLQLAIEPVGNLVLD